MSEFSVSLHAVKWLDSPVVFVVGCEEGLLPYIRRSVLRDAEESAGCSTWGCRVPVEPVLIGLGRKWLARSLCWQTYRIASVATALEMLCVQGSCQMPSTIVPTAASTIVVMTGLLGFGASTAPATGSDMNIATVTRR